MGVEGRPLPCRWALPRRRHARLCLLPRLGGTPVARLCQRHRTETLAGEALQCLVVGHAVARSPIVGGQIRPDARVVGEVAVAPQEISAGLLHRHQCQQIAVIGAGRLLVQKVWDGQQRARALHPQDLALPLAGQGQHGGRGALALCHGVEIPLEVGHQRDLALVEGAKWLARFNHGLDKRIGDGFSRRVSGVALEPVRVVQQAVAEHGLGLGIGHGGGRKLLGEAGGVAGDVGKVRRVASLVEQGVEPAPAAAHLGRIGQAGEIDHRRHPLPILPEARHRAVTEAVLVFSLPGQQIQGEGGTAILDAEPAEALDPILQRPGEGHVRVELAGHVTTHAVAQVVGQQGCFPLGRFQLRQTLVQAGIGAGDEVVKNGKQLLRAHLLVLVHLVIEVVAIAHGTGEAVAQRDDVKIAVVDHPLLQGVEHGERALAHRLVAAGGQRRAGGGQTAGHLAALLVQQGKLQPLATGEEIRLGGHQLVHQGGGTGIFDDVALEEGDPAPQAAPEIRLFGLGMHLPQHGQAGRIGTERLVGLFGRGEACLIVAGAHVGGPEQVLLASVHLQVIGIELVEIIPGNGTHNFPLVMGRPRGAHSFLVKCQPIHTSCKLSRQIVRRDARHHAIKSEGFCLLAILVVKLLNWLFSIATH